MTIEKKYYKISEVVKIVGEEAHTLRFWENEFKQSLVVNKKNDTRYYTKDNIQTLKDIKLLVRILGYTVEGAKAKLKTEKRGEVARKRGLYERLSALKSELIAIRRELNVSPAFARSVVVENQETNSTSGSNLSENLSSTDS